MDTGGRALFTILRLTRANGQQRRAARAAFAAGVGATGKQWEITHDRALLTHEGQTWLRARIATTATPYGVMGCSILVRVSCNGDTVTWPYRSAGFARNDPTAAIAQAAAALAQLEPDHYPDATHVALYLLSLGDVTRHGMHQS